MYRGRHKDFPGFVAIKAIPLQKIHINPGLRKMIEAEQTALKVVNHENVIRLLTVLQTNVEIDMIYEFCDQGSLGDILNRGHIVTEPEALKIMLDICNALICLKSHGIVHRDLKPENILLQNGKVKLADFGLCMVGAPTIQDNNTHIGSFLFMAPESLSSFVYDSKTDLYSAGLLV